MCVHSRCTESGDLLEQTTAVTCNDNPVYYTVYIHFLPFTVVTSHDDRCMHETIDVGHFCTTNFVRVLAVPETETRR
jgi:hypothetical protein